jgi:rhodanese-related sulfurtransferase
MAVSEPSVRATGIFGLLARASAIVVLGAGVGLTYNALSAQGIPLSTPKSLSVSEYVTWGLHLQGMRVGPEDARRAFDNRDAVFIDARSTRAYRAGHIPGAIQMTNSDVATRGEELLKDYPRDIRIITYCSGGRCQSSLRLASLLKEEMGFTNVGAFYEGWSAWKGAGHPVTTGEYP